MEKNKLLITAMWTILVTNVIFYAGIIFLAVFTLKSGAALGAVICAATVMLIAACCIALKFEISAGDYECKKCHYRFVPTYKETLISMHMGTTRYLKCPNCNKKQWAKKRF